MSPCSSRPPAVANASDGSMNEISRTPCRQQHSTSRQSSGLTSRRLPSANDKCLFNSFLNVENKLLVA